MYKYCCSAQHSLYYKVSYYHCPSFKGLLGRIHSLRSSCQHIWKVILFTQIKPENKPAMLPGQQAWHDFGKTNRWKFMWNSQQYYPANLLIHVRRTGPTPETHVVFEQAFLCANSLDLWSDMKHYWNHVSVKVMAFWHSEGGAHYVHVPYAFIQTRQS